MVIWLVGFCLKNFTVSLFRAHQHELHSWTVGGELLFSSPIQRVGVISTRWPASRFCELNPSLIVPMPGSNRKSVVTSSVLIYPDLPRVSIFKECFHSLKIPSLMKLSKVEPTILCRLGLDVSSSHFGEIRINITRSYSVQNLGN